MSCHRCKDERIIWAKDRFERPLAVNCQMCNKYGEPVKKEMKEWKRGKTRP